MMNDLICVAGMLATVVGMMWVFQMDGTKKHA